MLPVLLEHALVRVENEVEQFFNHFVHYGQLWKLKQQGNEHLYVFRLLYYFDYLSGRQLQRHVEYL
jgi:hypothetical protein